DPDDPTSCLTCSPGSTCAGGNPCDDDVFVCVECTSDLDCFGGDLCQLAACRAPCFDDGDCPTPALCNLAHNRCEL
ncbi:MAG: hypothetical protein AAGF11_56060, partial [Myxococcota bacterium]